MSENKKELKQEETLQKELKEKDVIIKTLQKQNLNLRKTIVQLESLNIQYEEHLLK
jgi:hypothetical protein